MRSGTPVTRRGSCGNNRRADPTRRSALGGRSGRLANRKPRMRVLITGNLGYVGPVVTRHLRRRFPNADLIGFDAGYFAHCLTTTGMLPETLLPRQHFGDVRDLRPDFLRGTDAIVHLAAISNDTMGSQFAAATDSVNRGA